MLKKILQIYRTNVICNLTGNIMSFYTFEGAKSGEMSGELIIIFDQNNFDIYGQCVLNLIQSIEEEKDEMSYFSLLRWTITINHYIRKIISVFLYNAIVIAVKYSSIPLPSIKSNHVLFSFEYEKIFTVVFAVCLWFLKRKNICVFIK